MQCGRAKSLALKAKALVHLSTEWVKGDVLAARKSRSKKDDSEKHEMFGRNDVSIARIFCMEKGVERNTLP